jgi:hypothetical protein
LIHHEVVVVELLVRGRGLELLLLLHSSISEFELELSQLELLLLSEPPTLVILLSVSESKLIYGCENNKSVFFNQIASILFFFL